MNDILIKLINNEKVTDTDIKEELLNICEDNHYSCNSNCPVYEKFGEIPWTKNNKNCLTFKSGTKMLYYLRKGRFI